MRWKLCVLLLDALLCWRGGSFQARFSLQRLRTQVVPTATSLHKLAAGTEPSADTFSSSIVDCLRHSLLNQDNATIVVEGYVTAKRSFGSSLAFVDLISNDDHNTYYNPQQLKNNNNNNNNDRFFQALLRREFYTGRLYYEGYRKILFPGTLWRLTGVAAPTRNAGEVVLRIHDMVLLQVPRQPQHVRAILTLARQGLLPIAEVATACELSTSQLQDGMRSSTNHCDKAWAKTIVSKLTPVSEELAPFVSPQSLLPQQRRGLPMAPADMRLPPKVVVLETSNNHHDTKEAPPPTTGTNTAPLSVRNAKKQFKPSPSSVTVAGFVQNRRRFHGNVTAVHLVDELSTHTGDGTDGVVDLRRLECVLHPNLLLAEMSQRYGNLLAVGCKVCMSGTLVASHVPTRTRAGDGSAVSRLWVHQISLIRLSWQPTTIQYALDVLYDKTLSVEEAAEALQLSFTQAKELSHLDDLTARQWKTNEISANLQSAASRMGRVPPERLAVLARYRDVREQWPLLETQEPELDDTSARQLLPESLPGSKWQRKKRPQLEWMVREIAQVARCHPQFGNRTLHILDIGGGKGKLANYLAQYLGDSVQVHVVDIAKGAIANGAMRARRLQLDVNYQVAAASATVLPVAEDIDIVVALHACGHLSDVALGHAVQHQAGFVVCPCCFSSNRHLRLPGSRRERVEDFLGISSADWNALKLVAEVQGDSDLSSEAIHTICGIRAKAVSQHLSSNSNCTMEIKSFPIQYSTRNICLVGQCCA